MQNISTNYNEEISVNLANSLAMTVPSAKMYDVQIKPQLHHNSFRFTEPLKRANVSVFTQFGVDLNFEQFIKVLETSVTPNETLVLDFSGKCVQFTDKYLKHHKYIAFTDVLQTNPPLNVIRDNLASTSSGVKILPYTVVKNGAYFVRTNRTDQTRRIRRNEIITSANESEENIDNISDISQILQVFEQFLIKICSIMQNVIIWLPVWLLSDHKIMKQVDSVNLMVLPNINSLNDILYAKKTIANLHNICDKRFDCNVINLTQKPYRKIVNCENVFSKKQINRQLSRI